MARHVLLSVLLLALVSPAAHADEVRLSNGDRYSGWVVRLDRGLLRFIADHGTLDIPWYTVVSVIVMYPIDVRVRSAPERRVTIGAVDDGNAWLEPGGSVPLQQILTMTRPQPTVTVTGVANAGFVSTGGNTDVNSLRADGEVVVQQRRNRHTWNAALNRAEDRGVETAQNWTISFRYDRFVNTQIYLNGSALFTSDPFRDFSLRTALGLAVGYQVSASPRLTLSVEAGYGYVDEDFVAAPDDRYHAVRETVRANVALVRPQRLVLFHRQDGFIDVAGNRNRFWKSQQGIRVGLVGNLVTTAQIDLDYDGSPAPGRRPLDRSVGLTFGYRF